ncbi:MAG: hypothetical protein J6D53_05250, partial [Blautia sp.]|nr:hypothetical protein [Blautia sp.]
RELYELASCSILPDMDLLRQKPLRETFPDTLIDLADTYLHLLEEEYALSFREDEDFYLTLLLYLQYLGKPIHNLNRSGISDRIIRVDHAVEFELAFRFQPLALSYYGNYLDFIELFYLMNILSGAIRNINTHQIRTVIMSYYNMPSAWNLRRMVEDSFREKIVVTALLPMHLKDSFDFSDTDLILTNADKQVVTDRELTVLKISPYFTDDDQRRIRGFLNQVRLRSLYRKDYPDITDLLRTADWEEKSDETVYLNLLDSVTKHEVQGGFITEECRLQILNHESLATFATHPVYIIVHTEVPAKETHIRVTTLDHRIVVGGHKIRMVILLCLKDTERGLLFKFYNELYGGDFDPNECRFMKTKEEFLEFFSKNLGT